jgi:ribosome recycling factor|tara:strand:+ start:197 stop:778 length:582 start_codon:yes stop_codon:yes gene_type:complete
MEPNGEWQMSDIDLDDIQRRMDGSLNSLKTEFMGLRAGRASTGMLEPIMVDAYGSKMPITQVGNISAPEPRLLTVTVWDASLTASVEKAIRESDLGLNPMAEGTLIRVPIPDLSEERRRDMVKVAGRYAEAARVSVRNVRRDGIESARKMEKDSLISEDERRDLESDIQKLTDDHVKMIDDALANKEKEITQV